MLTQYVLQSFINRSVLMLAHRLTNLTFLTGRFGALKLEDTVSNGFTRE